MVHNILYYLKNENDENVVSSEKLRQFIEIIVNQKAKNSIFSH